MIRIRMKSGDTLLVIINDENNGDKTQCRNIQKR
jgi:hypothetical protein